MKERHHQRITQTGSLPQGLGITCYALTVSLLADLYSLLCYVTEADYPNLGAVRSD